MLKKLKKSTKWMLLIGVAIVIAIGTVIGVSSCSRASYFQLALDNLSEARMYMKHASTDCCRVQFFAGMREEPYAVNGISEKKVAFGIINLEPCKIKIEAETLDGTLKIGEEVLPVSLERNPHGTNFATDIGKLVDVAQELVLTLTIGEATEVFNLTNAMPAEAISWERALEIAVDHLKDQIRKAGKFECYVKIVESPTRNGSTFWYVRFVPEKGDNFFAVIDMTGRVIS